MGKTPEDLRKDYQQVSDAYSSCPSTEELLSYIENELDEQKAALLEFHVYNCPGCSELVTTLESTEKAPAADRSDRKRNEKYKDLVAERLGFRRNSLFARISEQFEWLWTMRTPLYVPAGVAVILVCTVVYWGFLASKDSTAPVKFTSMSDYVTVTQASVRAESAERKPESVLAGMVVQLYIQIDFKKHSAGEIIQCVVFDDQGDELNRKATVTPNNFEVVVPMIFSREGTYTVELSMGESNIPFDTRDFIVLTPAGSQPQQ